MHKEINKFEGFQVLLVLHRYHIKILSVTLQASQPAIHITIISAFPNYWIPKNGCSTVLRQLKSHYFNFCSTILSRQDCWQNGHTVTTGRVVMPTESCWWHNQYHRLQIVFLPGSQLWNLSFSCNGWLPLMPSFRSKSLVTPVIHSASGIYSHKDFWRFLLSQRHQLRPAAVLPTTGWLLQLLCFYCLSIQARNCPPSARPGNNLRWLP